MRNTVKPNTVTNLEQPPQNLEAEEAVLGGLLIDPCQMERLPFLRAEHFLRARHGLIYAAMLALYNRREPCSILAVSDELERHGKLAEIGGAAALGLLVNATPTSAHTEQHARLVERAALFRKLARAGQSIAGIGFDQPDDLDEARTKAEAALYDVWLNHTTGKIIAPGERASRAFSRYEAAQRGERPGTPYGFHDLDGITQGAQPGQLVLVAGRPSMGKCFAPGTPILMADGSTMPVEEVQVGNLVMGPDSRARTVLALGCGTEQMYRVSYDDGSAYVVNASHILSLKRSKSEGLHKHGDILNIPVRDYLTKGPGFQSRYKGYKVAIELPERPISLDPYLFGLWLGDGCTSKPEFTTVDPEIISYLEAWATEHGLECHAHATANRTTNYAIRNGGNHKGRGVYNELTARLRSYGVMGGKYIPDDYLQNSSLVRMQLLAGILDTDGHLQKSGHLFEYVSKIERLAKNVDWLAQSLGFRTTCHRIQRTCYNNGVSNWYWRIRISGPLWKIPTRLPNKHCPEFRMARDVLHRAIRVQPLGLGRYYGFEIDGDGLLVLGDFTVTHNTSLMQCSAERMARAGKNVLFCSAEMAESDLTDRAVAGRIGRSVHALQEGCFGENVWTSIADVLGREIGEDPMYVYDDADMTTSSIRAVATEMRSRIGLDVLFVDYLQILHDGYGKSDNERVGYISRQLKAIARHLSVPVIAGSQLNRDCEDRRDKKPALQDLRDSGTLEQDADVVMLLYRPGFYWPDNAQWQKVFRDEPYPGANVTQVIIGKQRQGRRGVHVKLLWEGTTMQFEGVDEHHER